MIKPEWKTYICKSCGSPYEGAYINPEELSEFDVEQLDLKYLPDMCPVCGKEQGRKGVFYGNESFISC